MKGLSFVRAMAVAAREGVKTQTRRVIAPQPPESINALHGGQFLKRAPYDIECPETDAIIGYGFSDESHIWRCPYGKPGDRLYVREEYYQFGHWEPVEGVLTKGGRQKWAFVPRDEEVLFDPPAAGFRSGRHHETPDFAFWHKRLGRFMPRKYARTFLEIVSVRVERLQDISEADAMAEGVNWQDYAGLANHTARKLYITLWESINGPGSWAANPYVFVVEFKRVEGGLN